MLLGAPSMARHRFVAIENDAEEDEDEDGLVVRSMVRLNTSKNVRWVGT